MLFLRTYLFPHILFLLFLLLAGALLGIRFRQHFSELDRIQEYVDATAADLQLIDQIHLVLGQLARDTEDAAAGPGTELLAIFAATADRFIKLTDTLRVGIPAHPVTALELRRLPGGRGPGPATDQFDADLANALAVRGLPDDQATTMILQCLRNHLGAAGR